MTCRQLLGLSFLLVAPQPRAAVAQQPVVGVRVATTYAMLGPNDVDTADASRTFIAALTNDARVKVLPRVTPELLANNASRPALSGSVDAHSAVHIGRLEVAHLFLFLTVSGRSTNAVIRVDIADIETGNRLAHDSVTVDSATSLAAGLTALGHTAARRVASLSPR